MADRNDIDRRKFLKAAGSASVLGLAGCTGGGGGGGGDGWVPEQNVRVVVPWGAGGGTDTAVRQVAQPLAGILEDRGIDIELNVSNITGAGGLNGATSVLNQPADGHSIFADTSVLAPQIAQGSADFTFDDWRGVARMQWDTSWVFSRAGEGAYEDVNEFVDTAKDEGILWGLTGGLSSAAFPVQFCLEAGIIDDTDFVAYDDAGRMTTDLLSGEVDAVYDELVDQLGQIEGGDVKPLFVGAAEAFPDWEDVPNIAETGWEADYGTQRALVVRDGTPQEAIDFWMDLVEEAMQTDEYQSFAADNYLDVKQGFLPGPDHIENLKEQVELFETVIEHT